MPAPRVLPDRAVRLLPLTPLAPAIVIIVGVAIALAIAFASLGELRRASDRGAALKASIVASALAARARAVTSEDRAAVLTYAAERTGVDVMLLSQTGEVIVDTTPFTQDRNARKAFLTQGAGIAHLEQARVAYASEQLAPPYGHLVLIAFAHAPAMPAGARALLITVASIASALAGMAAFASYTFAKTARDDMIFVRDRIEQMAGERATRVADRVPIRTFDQVGVLTAELNMLVERFAAAERAYQQDLEEADALDRARAQFLAALSHELRTPLNAVLGFADVLLSGVEGELTPSAREDIEIIRKSGEHLRSLIDDILDLSALESGNLRLDRGVVDIAQIAEEVAREASPLVAGKPVILHLDAPRGALAFADKRRVRQILANLVGNAAKFTSKGRIDIRIRTDEVSVWIEVADTGPGIPEGARALIFEEFEQEGDTVSRRKGTGLGLAIARRLTVMHAGKLSLESELGKGSIFRVELPVRPEPRESAEAPVGSPNRGVSSAPPPADTTITVTAVPSLPPPAPSRRGAFVPPAVGSHRSAVGLPRYAGGGREVSVLPAENSTLRASALPPPERSTINPPPATPEGEGGNQR